MAVPAPDDGDFWRWLIGVAVGACIAAGGVVRWLLGRIEEVRDEARKERDASEMQLRDEIQRARTELASQLSDHRAEALAWHREANKFREAVIALMVTRAELERQLGRQRDELIDRLDVRITPLVDAARRREPSGP